MKKARKYIQCTITWHDGKRSNAKFKLSESGELMRAIKEAKRVECGIKEMTPELYHLTFGQ